MGDWFRGSPYGPGLKLSNGATAVFLDVLALPACELAETDFERGFALLLCNSRIGLGNDGFDLDELPWSGAGWEAEREFLLRVVRLAVSRFRWELLRYEPPYVEVYLGEYERVVREFRPPAEPVELPRLWDPEPVEAAFVRCPEHGLYLGDYTDCRLCL
ncbi:hypothetical protein [Kribbella speibonae]|uniref:Uncharacterized protein n=1 Tax=Kribbella speibonae TaxID=1572660 RepID=A0A4R0IDW1_9ACTN|nr:hypothetical protein [Kribbella speibonae]TCC30144.1 hypothetical protein E0H92_39940 [Kribbella speibonae]